MRTHTCPEDICNRFAGDEEEKRAARKLVIEWIGRQLVQVGDLVLLPNGATGEIEEWTKTSNGMAPTPALH